MNKAAPWNINGVGVDARGAAREAARRQGKSLGEWLHGVIADHAAEFGIEEHEVDGEDRIAAITSRLERLGARTAPFDRRPATGRGEDAVKRREIRPERDPAEAGPRRRAATRRDGTWREDSSREDTRREDAWREDTWPEDTWRDETRRDETRLDGTRREGPNGAGDRRTPRAAPPAEETDFLLEKAIDAVEHRAQRVEKRTDNALASFAKMLEANEAKRDREREAVLAMGQKLSAIETRLSAGPVDDGPIKGALARLEARLDTISRRAAAETATRQEASTSFPQAGAGEPLRRLEEKVNSILHVVARQQEMAPLAAADAAEPLRASPAAVVAAQGAAPLPHRRLGDAIADISRRQRSLDDRQTPPRPGAGGDATGLGEVGRGASGRTPASPQPRHGGSESEIASLASKIEDMRREMTGRGQPRAEAAADVAGLRSEIATMSQALRGLAPRGSVAAIEDAIKALTLRLEASREQTAGEAAGEAARPALDIVGDLRRALAEIDPRKTIASLQNEVHSIGARIEGMNAKGIDRPALERLQEQMRDIRDMIAASAARSLDVEHIEGELSVLVERMDRQMRQSGATQDFATTALAATADDIRRMIEAAPGAAAFEKIERRLEALAAKVDASIESADRHADRTRSQFGSAFGTLAQVSAAASAAAPAPDMSGLERLVRELGDKIEAVRAPGAGAQAIEALQHQITALSSRFDDAEGGLGSLATIERAMGDLFAHLEETRASVDTAANRAAREALRIAAEEGRGVLAAQADTRGEHELAVLRSLQEEADKRTHATLNAVHETLDKVVGRLSTVEGDIAQVRATEVRATEIQATEVRAAEMRAAEARAHAARPTADEDAADRPLAAPSAQRPVIRGGPREPAGPGVLVGVADPMIDAMRRAPGRRASPVDASVASGPRTRPIDLDGEAGRADFIAAARRAAHAAQNDPSVIAMKRPAAGASEARAGLIARSREYVATHKKPVLLSIAAIFVVLGTLVIMQRAGFEDVGTQVASAPAAKVQRVAALTPPKAPMTAPATPSSAPGAEAAGNPAPGDLSPSALPKPTPALASQIPGSDPIQTGSIPSLPAFASGTGVAATRPSLPPGLKSMADAGDGAAQFELGASYAEGKLVPRDFATAARWYAKAADQGVAPAQYRLASLYEKGLGVGRDKAKAKALYLKAAEAGNPRAMHNLAVMLADGDGKPDYDGAATWFRKAAQFGVHDSQFNLAILLARGLGVQQSLVQSYQWFAIAADQNDEDAAKKRDEIAAKLGANDLAVAKALASSFRPRNANVAATEVVPPAGGWDGAAGASRLNSARPKISSL